MPLSTQHKEYKNYRKPPLITNNNKNKQTPLTLEHIPSTNHSHSDVTTNSSYYSPQSSQASQSVGSLSPLSIHTLSHDQSQTNDTAQHHYNGGGGIVYSNYRKYKFLDKQSVKFSQQVFVAMHTTRQLAWYTMSESWGDKNSLLFKYLDYTFRCAAFRDEVYAFDIDSDHHQHHQHPSSSDLSSMDERLVFNTGLLSRKKGECIYLILTPNAKKSVAQQWRVEYGDPYNRHNASFVSAQWLIRNVINSTQQQNAQNLLPKAFKLNVEAFNAIKYKFKRNKLVIEADFDHIVTKYYDRIIAEYNKR